MMGRYGYGGGYGYGNMMNGGWLGLFLMVFVGAVIVGLIILLVLRMMRSSSGHGYGHPMAPGGPASAPGHDEAVAIAKRRFASGEITKEQYDEIMGSLKG